jgi:hypothetical protein
LFSICMTGMFPCAWNWLPDPSTMQMRSVPSVRAHHQRQETDTAVHEKTAFCENLPRMPYAIGQVTEIPTSQAFRDYTL